MAKPGTVNLGAEDQGALSVSELMAGLHQLIKNQVGRIWVQGEISNFTRAASGHCYFTLKDRHAQVRAVLFRGVASNLRFEPENGLEVLVMADAAVYEQRGELQLVVRRLEPQGQGALQLAFEQLKSRLAKEGLFDEDRKCEWPELPRGIGIVASKHSAALHDVLQVSGRRFPQIPVVIAHSRVQGEGAEFEIAQALEDLAQWPDLDVLLLVRGGGSLEDLRCFNTEVVARAIAACPLPVVSGVGHEVDVTIADLVADLRAPTPSAAAELVWPSAVDF
ncbi:MAG: exodeoxyribonuclease VII large subunit, partial [Deltaproteobacteria bacterium]|nr:exodeoxyribonuclease VII large subunit [Deltaproteobacteria bacterium]